MKFRRSSDSQVYTLAWWSVFTLINIGLLYYAYSKVTDVLSREFFSQIKPRLSTDATYVMSFPDIMICTSDSTVSLEDESMVISEYLTVSRFNVSQARDQGACPGGDEVLTIFSTNNLTIDHYLSVEAVISITWNKAPSIKSKNFVTTIGTIIFIPKEDNPFRRHKGIIPKSEYVPYHELTPNLYTLTLHSTVTEFNIIPKTTRVLRKDFWGLFGYLEDTPKYSVSSSSFNWMDESLPNTAKVYVHVPYEYRDETQVLTTSLPDAVADLGGAISISLGLFYLIFGVTRIDPFGLVTLCFFRKRTRNKICEANGPKALTSVSAKGGELGITNNTQGSLSFKSISSRTVGSLTYAPSRPQSDHSIPLPETLQEVIEKLAFQDECIREHKELIRRQEDHIRIMESKYHNLEGILGEYYLDMDILNENDLPTKTCAQWCAWALPHNRQSEEEHEFTRLA